MLLLIALAEAGTLGLALGAGAGLDQEPGRSYVSASPTVAATWDWHLGPLELWVGGFGSALTARERGATVPVALALAEAGAGFGGPPFSAGWYAGIGFPAAELGGYARLNVRGASWADRTGAEFRVFVVPEYETVAFTGMLRAEFGGPEGRVAGRRPLPRPAPEERPPRPPPDEPPPVPPGPPPER